MKKLTIVMLFTVLLAVTNAKEYMIQSGDILGKIARENNTTSTAIAKMNGIMNPDLIYAGAKIMIPEGKYKINVFNEFSVKEEYAEMFKEALMSNVSMMPKDNMMMKKADAKFLVNADDATSLLFIGRGETEEAIEDLTYKLQAGKIEEMGDEAIKGEPSVSFMSPIYSTNGEYLRTPSKLRKPYILFYVFAIEEGNRWETIQEVRKYLYRTRKERGTLLADFYGFEGEGNENMFLIHQEFYTEKYFMNEHAMKTYTNDIESFLNNVLDDSYEPMVYVYKEL